MRLRGVDILVTAGKVFPRLDTLATSGRWRLIDFVNRAAWLALVVAVSAAPVGAAWLSTLPLPADLAVALIPVAIVLAASRFQGRERGISLPAWTCTRTAWCSAVAVGAALRVAWPVLAPVTLSSDSLSYYSAALRLLHEGRIAFPYPEDHPTVMLLAWRPPGFIILLGAWFSLFGTLPGAIVALNIAIYLGTAAALARLVYRAVGYGAVFPALVALACWPVGIGTTGVALSESTSVLTYLLAVLLFESATRGRAWWAVLAGIVAGFGVLVRPSMLPVPVLWLARACIARTRFQRTLAIATLATGCMMLTILPWTARNYLELHHPILLSTNAGSVLYRANNSFASGGYSWRGERDLDALVGNEVLWNATGSKWAREWIVSHPVQFATLAIKKQARFWGFDEAGNGPRAFSPAFAAAHPAAIRIIEVVCNAWWFALLASVLAALVVCRRRFWTEPMLVESVLAILLLTAVHAVYESHPRYHQPLTGFLALIAATPFVAPRYSKGMSSDQPQLE